MGVTMTKILLVEDDKSLREIYGVRLLAEGYQIATAGDGEEALAMAIKEKPDLIISDVMMPKISGFDMLDILRSTPETKEIKVIMMTALSSEDQRARGESLGANRYLVKSQVGIEDVVRTVHDVLADAPVAVKPASQAFGAPISSTTPAPAPQLQPQSQPVTIPVQAPVAPVEPVQAPVQAPAATPFGPSTPVVDEPTDAPTPVLPPMPMFVPQPVSAPEPIAPVAPQPVTIPVQAPVAPVEPVQAPVQAPAAMQPEILQPTITAPSQLPQPTAPFSTPSPTPLNNRIINPMEPSSAVDISTLINQELNGPTPPPTPQA